jgi:ubiquinone/menaquinone biosynthesis C-methylase UbiE
MAGWFRKGLSPHHTALAMIGARAGDRVVVLGANDAGLAAEVALVTGLNGTTTVCGEDAARARVEDAAGDAGALVEFEAAPLSALPFENGSRDVAVLASGVAAQPPDERDAAVAEAMRVLRPGGRVVLIDRAKAGGLFRSAAPRRPAADAIAILRRAGAGATRQLADVDGIAYYEGRKLT